MFEDGGWDGAQPFDEPFLVEDAGLFQEISPLIPWKVTGIRKPAGRLPDVMGATMTVRR